MKDQTNSNKIVLYFAGGTMRGVFGAGVAKILEENNMYHKISAIYTASVGTLIGAYFLSKQTELGASIAWEDGGKVIISKRNFFVGMWQRFKNKFIKAVPHHELRNSLNIDKIIDIMKNEKRLNAAEVIEHNISFFVKLFNVDTHEIEYIDARRPDIFEILKAGINVFPYMHEVSVIDNKKYIDGAIMDIIGIDLLQKKHPNEKIIIIMNSGHIDRKLRYRLKNMLEGKFMQWMFNDKRFYKLYASAETRLAEDLKTIRQNEHIIIAPDKDVKVRSRTTNPDLLRATYKHGKEIGKRILKDKNII